MTVIKKPIKEKGEILTIHGKKLYHRLFYQGK